MTADVLKTTVLVFFAVVLQSRSSARSRSPAARPTCCSSRSSRSRSCAARSGAPRRASRPGCCSTPRASAARRDVAAAHRCGLLDRPLRRDDGTRPHARAAALRRGGDGPLLCRCARAPLRARRPGRASTILVGALIPGVSSTCSSRSRCTRSCAASSAARSGPRRRCDSLASRGNGSRSSRPTRASSSRTG